MFRFVSISLPVASGLQPLLRPKVFAFRTVLHVLQVSHPRMGKSAFAPLPARRSIAIGGGNSFTPLKGRIP
ncbi:hypothetical protein [Aurantiacibacter gangjinensis]|uniref:hypothetical protein n=1 Tax=Aurantiacibacter gangjinensis TaxID=502682 RepID=UPI0012E085C8|nr:hypothetical protein [Aurantiacibacter gangjinensis]